MLGYLFLPPHPYYRVPVSVSSGILFLPGTGMLITGIVVFFCIMNWGNLLAFIVMVAKYFNTGVSSR